MERIILILILCFGTMIMTPGQEQQAGKLLSEAIYQEEVNGELDEAIKTYQSIVQQYPDDRKVSAEALLHLGICYEKIGMPQAYDTYQDIIEKYAEQQDEVALARKRMDHLRAYSDDIDDKAEQHLKTGNELFRQWEYVSAIQEYEKVIELRPNTVLAQNAQYNIGQSYLKAGLYEDALTTKITPMELKLIKKPPTNGAIKLLVVCMTLLNALASIKSLSSIIDGMTVCIAG